MVGVVPDRARPRGRGRRRSGRRGRDQRRRRATTSCCPGGTLRHVPAVPARRAWVCSGNRGDDNTLPTARRASARPTARSTSTCHRHLRAHAVVPASAAVASRAELPFDVACLIGCGVATGVGAVVNTAQVRPARRSRSSAAAASASRCSSGARSPARTRSSRSTRGRRSSSCPRGRRDARRSQPAGSVPADVRAIVPDFVDYTFEAIGLEGDDRADARPADAARRHDGDGRA